MRNDYKLYKYYDLYIMLLKSIKLHVCSAGQKNSSKNLCLARSFSSCKVFLRSLNHRCTAEFQSNL